ncbi:MAG TPA: insulinase family protein [Longimicrobiales bacterium]
MKVAEMPGLKLVSLFSLAFLALPGLARAQNLTDPLPVDPSVTVGRLANGMTYYIRVNKKPEARAELRLAVNAGSVLEDEKQLGLAHFVEHMAFNGTRNFQKHELINYLESIGMRFGADLNAYTSFDETVYMLTVPTDTGRALEQGFRILEDWAHNVSFDPAEIAKERGVVIEEWRLGQGAEERMRDKYFPVLFRGSQYAVRLPIGTKASLETFTPADLTRFYRDFYRPDLMSVIAVGDFDKNRVEQLIKTHFGNIPARTHAAQRKLFPVPDHDSTLVAITTDKEATISTVSVYYKLPLQKGSTIADYRAMLMGNLFSSMLNARLRELTEQADPPFLGASSAQGQLIRTKEAFFLSAATKDDEILRGLDAVLTEAVRVQKHGFTATELERARQNTLRFMEAAHAEREKTESADYADEYIGAFLEAEPIPGIDAELQLTRQLLSTISAPEVNALVQKWMTDRNRVVVIQAPEKEGVQLPTTAQVLAAFGNVGNKQIAAYEDDTGGDALIERLRPMGKVVAERKLPAVQMTEWTLSNGARVLLKPTDFQDDEIIMRAYSRGGSSLVSDRDLLSASFAVPLVSQSGYGAFSASQLGKALAGKVARVSPFIGDREEGLTGSASPRDFETMLQLAYLVMTDARRDSAAYMSLQSRLAAVLENQSRDPESAFRDTLQVTLAQHHVRARPITAAMLKEIDMERALAIYRERFANAGDFTFVFVGNFTPDSIKPLVEKYLAALPGSRDKERARDDGQRPPKGVIEKTVRRGVEPKSMTQIVFSGPFEFTLPNRLALSLMTEVLDLRLRDVLREDLSGTYGVSINSSGGRDPVPQYTVSIGFGADPQRLESLTKEVFQQIEKFKRAGPTAEELAKVKETQRREWETNVKRNGYWASQISARDMLGEPVADVLSFPQRLETATPAMLQAAAQRYLRGDNYVRVSLYPER